MALRKEALCFGKFIQTRLTVYVISYLHNVHLYAPLRTYVHLCQPMCIYIHVFQAQKLISVLGDLNFHNWILKVNVFGGHWGIIPSRMAIPKRFESYNHRIDTHTHTHVYIYISIYVYIVYKSDFRISGCSFRKQIIEVPFFLVEGHVVFRSGSRPRCIVSPESPSKVKSLWGGWKGRITW